MDAACYCGWNPGGLFGIRDLAPELSPLLCAEFIASSWKGMGSIDAARSSGSNAGHVVGIGWLVVDKWILSGGPLGIFAFRCVQSMRLLLAVRTQID